MNNFGDQDEDYFPKMTFNNDQKHGKGHHNGGHNQDKDEDYSVDKKVLQERRIQKLMTRGAFVSFLMWTFILIAAITGKRAAWNSQNSKWWMRCSFKKAIVFLVLASGMGIWKMINSSKIMKQMERFQREIDNEGKEDGKFNKKHHGGKGKHVGEGRNNNQWNFNEIKQMSKQDQMEMVDEMF